MLVYLFSCVLGAVDIQRRLSVKCFDIGFQVYLASELCLCEIVRMKWWIRIKLCKMQAFGVFPFGPYYNVLSKYVVAGQIKCCIMNQEIASRVFFLKFL